MTVDIIEQTGRSSPLAAYAARLAALPAGVSVREVPYLTQLDLRVTPSSASVESLARVLGVRLPTEPCTSVSGSDGVEVLWLGPDEWLVVAPPDRAGPEGELREALAGEGAVVDVSAHRTTIAVDGPRARDLLAHGCAIDLDLRVSPPGTCVQTFLALAGVVLVVREAGDLHLLVRSSFARYLADWLLDACEEYLEDPLWQ